MLSSVKQMWNELISMWWAWDKEKKLALCRENNIVSVFLKQFKTMWDFSLVLLNI